MFVMRGTPLDERLPIAENVDLKLLEAD